ncbi:hypothetical protein JCM11641_002966 [Rhodosporidiobolus odoratus]
MSYSKGGQPRRTAPLISRPSGSSPAAPPTFSSGLGGAIAGALGGMGYSAPPPPKHGGHGVGVYGQQGGGGALPPLHFGIGGGYGQPGERVPPAAYGQPQHYGQQPNWVAPPQQYQPYPSHSLPPPSAYPPSVYPPSHQLHHQPAPPPSLPYASTSSIPYPHRPQHSCSQPPQTTSDGYTFSSAYDPSLDLGPTRSSSGPGSGLGKRSRGPGGPGGDKQQANQGPQIVSCCQEGCGFTGRKKQVQEHEEDRHLIYAPGREPKPWSGSLKPIDGAVIEGTGLSLDTPEAVAKWIAERKKRWPSQKVVNEKEKARAERIAAGLEAPPRERGGRGRGRGRGQADFGGRGRGRGGRGGYVGNGREGGAEEPAAKRWKGEEDKFEKVKQEGDQPSSTASEGSDSDSSSGLSLSDEDSGENDDGPPEEGSSKREKAALCGEGEDEEHEEDDENDDGPEEEGTKQGATGEQGEAAGEPKKQFQVVCRHWRKGNCGLGDEKCPYLHHIPANAPPPALPKRKRPAPPPPPHNPFARPASFSSDPFALLAERDHRHIVSDVLQVIEFLGANDWLRGVEIRPGQVEEESGIEVLAETQNGGVNEEEVEKVEATTSAIQGPSVVYPPPAAPPSSLLGMLADYGSDSDDEADEQAVAASLVGP